MSKQPRHGHKGHPSSSTSTPVSIPTPPIDATTSSSLSISTSPTAANPNPSFTEFQATITQQQRDLKPKAPPTSDEELTTSFDELDLVGTEADDNRTLEDRITTIDDTTSNAAVAALLVRSLQLAHGELLLAVGPHNLAQKTLVSLLEDPDMSTAPAETDATNQGISQAKVDSIMSTLKGIVAGIGIEISLLWNPWDSVGNPKELVGNPKELAGKGTEVPSSVNVDSVTTRWTSKALRLLVRRIPEGVHDLSEARVAVCGNVDAGKSTLLGVLTKGRLDDGRGRARVSLFRHKHEVESGRTSSVGMELLGFTAAGKEVLPDGLSLEKENENQRKPTLTWEEISAKASKVISFADLAGHERYLKTTLFGLTATQPDFVMLIVGGNAGLVGMSKEHLSVTLALSVPVICIVTKVDMTPPNILEQTVKQLAKVLKSPGCRKQPVFVKDVGMACELASGFVDAKACPIFLISAVTGEGLPLLKTFLNVYHPQNKYPVDEPLEFSVSDVFSVAFVGSVVSGIILSGKVAVGDTVLVGPDSLGGFATTAIKSIQRKRVNVLHAEAGQSVSFALKRIKRAGIRKGMVILPKSDVMPQAVMRFQGSVLVLYHNTLISPRYQAHLHCGSVRQTVQIDAILDRQSGIRTGDRATLEFSFIKHKEWLKLGDRFLFREGRTRALGIVTKLL